MTISRKLAHKVQDRLQLIMSLVEAGFGPPALTEIHKLSELIERHVEDADEERARLNC